MFDKIAGIVQGAGAVAGALGGGKSQQVQQTQSGFAALPKEVQDYLLKQQLPKIQAYGETPFATVPYRRAGAAELDPVFGSKALQDLQRLNDQRVMQQFATPQPAQDARASSSSIDDNMLEALAFMNKAGTAYNPTTRQNADYSAKDIKSLAELLEFYKKQTGGQMAQSYEGLMKYALSDPKMADMYTRLGRNG
jgi:hypothetical protein